MAAIVYKGWHEARGAGLLEGTPDVRNILVMSSFTGATQKLAVNLDDFVDLDEFDGVGYGRQDCAGVSAAYADADEEWQLDWDDDVEAFGDDVAPGAEVVYGMVTYLYVDGTAANDIALGFTDDGFGVNAANGKLGLTLPVGGLIYNA